MFTKQNVYRQVMSTKQKFTKHVMFTKQKTRYVYKTKSSHPSYVYKTKQNVFRQVREKLGLTDQKLLFFVLGNKKQQFLLT